MIRAIVCASENWGIGRNNNLIFNLKQDMKFFTKMTTGNIVVMGERTLLSLPGGKSLKNRYYIISFLGEGGMAQVYVANDVINKQESYTPEFVDELMNEFYELDGAILFESNKGKVLNTSLFKRFLSKKSIVRNPVRKILEEKGFILSTTIYNPIIGKTVRAMIDTRF